MIEFINSFFKNKRYTAQDLSELEDIRNNLDPRLKTCAEESFDFGRKKEFTLKLNEVGMVQLILHLDRHGFEIKRKEQT